MYPPECFLVAFLHSPIVLFHFQNDLEVSKRTFGLFPGGLLALSCLFNHAGDHFSPDTQYTLAEA